MRSGSWGGGLELVAEKRPGIPGVRVALLTRGRPAGKPGTQISSRRKVSGNLVAKNNPGETRRHHRRQFNFNHHAATFQFPNCRMTAGFVLGAGALATAVVWPPGGAVGLGASGGSLQRKPLMDRH